MSLTSKHISFARLADLVEGRLPANEARDERAHLDACARCSEQAAQLGRVTAIMRADTSEDAPHDAIFNVVQMFRSRPAAAREPGLLRRIVAALTFDSNALAPAFGVRSGQNATARQLLFSAGDFDVDLRLAAGGEGWTVSGQVLGPCAGGEVELGEAGQAATSSAALNDLCEFTLPPVPEGSYALRLRLGNMEVEIPELDLRV
jgi:anti-sigma factor RsiW